MKKFYALGLLVVPLFLAAAWMGARTVEEAPQQEPVVFPGYTLESDHFAMEDLGNLLERVGREIQQDERITLGGNSYPVSGFGGIELKVRAGTNRDRDLRTAVQLGFSTSGRTTPPTGPAGRPRQDYDPYQRGGGGWQPSAVGDLIAELAETLAGTGTIVLEHHRVPFRGAAHIDQRLVESTRGRGFPYQLEVHVLFGEGEFDGPDDDEDYTEDQEHGLIRSLARDEQEGADRAAVAQMFASLAGDLKAGRVRVGNEQLPAGDNVQFGLTHVTANDGSYDKIEFSLGFGPVPPRRQPGETRYGDEQFNEPITDLAAILQRIGAQILEDGTFELGGETFSASRMASWEIGASPGGFAVEVSYHQPPER